MKRLPSIFQQSGELSAMRVQSEEQRTPALGLTVCANLATVFCDGDGPAPPGQSPSPEGWVTKDGEAGVVELAERRRQPPRRSRPEQQPVPRTLHRHHPLHIAPPFAAAVAAVAVAVAAQNALLPAAGTGGGSLGRLSLVPRKDIAQRRRHRLRRQSLTQPSRHRRQQPRRLRDRPAGRCCGSARGHWRVLSRDKTCYQDWNLTRKCEPCALQLNSGPQPRPETLP